VTPPIGWLMDYWMGRYYGFIQAPAADDQRLVLEQNDAPHHLSAAPYAGPRRPRAAWEQTAQ
jgi:hypothetical protein